MEILSQEQCVPCRGDSPPATTAEIAQLRLQIPGWEIIEIEGVACLQKTYRFKDFASALALTQHVGEQADREGHHPVLVTEWGKVTVRWWTHAINGLHRNDFVMAAKTDRIALSL
ncbi:MAG: 4a-hydroxytetrahydrobiopterin dehydratase [Cyanobacteria bacterium J06641_5]